jgi:hypothetical protein
MALHVGLEIASKVGWWQWMMFVLLTVFLPARWTGAMVERIERIARIGSR